MLSELLLKELDNLNNISNGHVENSSNINKLQSIMSSFIPEWYCEVLRSWPIAGCRFMFCKYGVDVPIEWNGVELILSESFDAGPGKYVLSRGYVAIASCSLGSGDPYFVNFNESNNPAVIQIYHDSVSPSGKLGKNSIGVVASSMAEFFHNARVDNS